MAIKTNRPMVSKVFNATVNATKAEVDDNAGALIHSITVLNATAAEAFLQVFDADADDVTVGTTVRDFVIGCDAVQQLHCAFPVPIHFTTGFTIASTTARDGNTNAVMEVTITYSI